MENMINYGICILAIGVLVIEAVLIIKRNHTIIVKGKDDFFSFALVMLFAMLILNPSTDSDFLGALRGSLVLMALFFSMAVKRGVSERGIEKLGFYVSWDQTETIQIAPYQMSKLELNVYSKGKRYRVLFSQHQLKKLVYEIQNRYPEVMIEDTLKI